MSVSAYNSTDISKLETYYPLNIDTQFTDVVGNINLSQCSQAYVPVDAVVDEGTEKEGSSSYFHGGYDIDCYRDLNAESNWSLSLWFNATGGAFYKATPTSGGIISCNVFNYGFDVSYRDSTKQIYFHDTNKTNIVLYTNVSLNKFYYIDLESYGNNTLDIYIYEENGTGNVTRIHGFNTTQYEGSAYYFNQHADCDGVLVGKYTSLVLGKLYHIGYTEQYYTLPGVFDDIQIKLNDYDTEEEVTERYYHTLSGFNLNEIESNATILSPDDYTQTNESVVIEFNFSNAEDNDMDCSLYVDGELNLTNTSLSVNTDYEFRPELEDGIHTYYINCTDGLYANAITETRNVYQDKTEPSISLSIPSVFGTTIFDDYTMSFIGNATNLNLTTVDRRIFYPNGTQYHRNLTVDFTNPQIISWSDEFNTTPQDNGVWNYYVYAQDSLNNVKTVNLTFTIDNCVPDWYCSNFTECNTTDQQTCNEATDSNNCSYPYSGDYSEFIVSECDYCSADIEIYNQTECALQEQTTCYIDNNFGTCCNVTGLESDCPQNESIVCVTSECTSFDYDEEDISASIISFITKLIIITGLLLSPLVVILGIYFVGSQIGIFGK